MSYYATQTLVHKKTGKLARLDPALKGSAFNWDRSKKGTRFISEEGNIFFDDVNNYTHISDEWGNVYAEVPAKGQHVDITAKKYVGLSNRKKAAMREVVLRRVRRDAPIFAAKMVETLLNPPPRKSGHSHEYAVEFTLDPVKVENNHSRFNFAHWGSNDDGSYGEDSIQFFTPKLGGYYNFIEFFVKWLKKQEWEVLVIRRKGLERKPFIYMMIATKDNTTIEWNAQMDSDLSLVKSEWL